METMEDKLADMRDSMRQYNVDLSYCTRKEKIKFRRESTLKGNNWIFFTFEKNNWGFPFGKDSDILTG